MKLNELNKNDIIQLYNMSVDITRRSGDTHQSRIASFLTLLSGLFAATIAGLIASKDWYDFILISIGPITIFYVSHIAHKAISGCYSVFLRNVIIQSKYEQILGLTVPNVDSDDQFYWLGESIIPKSQIDSRKKYSSSNDWYDYYMKNGSDQIIVKKLFIASKILSIVLFIACFFLMSCQVI